MIALFTIKQGNALKWWLAQGYVPIVGGFTDKHNLEFRNLSASCIEYHDIDSISHDYVEDMKASTRRRAAEKRERKHSGGVKVV